MDRIVLYRTYQSFLATGSEVSYNFTAESEHFDVQ
jgi:hypothetical protein